MAAATVYAAFEGLRELDQALGMASLDLRTTLRRDLRGIADIVAVEARSIALAKGLVDSGDLIRDIRPFAYEGRAGVRSSAMHRGFRYPRRLEFESRGPEVYGPRASLLPAVDVKADDLFAAAEGLLDRLAIDLAA